jgi:DNA topoisomerase-1
MMLVSEDPQRIARKAKLKYILDDSSGFVRKPQGRGFRFEYSSGKRVSAEKQLERIRQLAIPPAWSEVWICKSPTGHLQATGRDDAGRKQYIYHQRWQAAVSQIKFDHLLEFGKRLPHLRAKVQLAMRKSNPLPHRMLAALIRILDQTGIRIGNESYTKENGSYGLTTLLGKHLKLHKSVAELHFPGKSHQKQHVLIEDAKVVRFLKELERKPNQPLFAVDAQEVNALLQELCGIDFSTKDFRTWIASARFAQQLASQPATDKVTENRQTIKQAIENVADFLGHTPTICRQYYLHPALEATYLTGDLSELAHSFHPHKRKWLRKEDQFLSHILGKLAKA